MKASENKYLTVANGVALNDANEEVICLLDPSFEKHELHAVVTSCIRTYDGQLAIIRREAIRVGLTEEHSGLETIDLNTLVMFDSKMIPLWVEVWSECLARGAMVNPPTPTACLFPYTKPNGEKRHAGNVVPTSAHQQGKAFDIGGGRMLDAIVVVVSAAFISGTIPGLKGYLKEPVNNCCHCDVRIL